jgi:hypothetical protein
MNGTSRNGVPSFADTRAARNAVTTSKTAGHRPARVFIAGLAVRLESFLLFFFR